MIADWIDAELRNWAAWCWSGEFPGPRPHDRAASAEGRYLPPSDLGDEPEQPRVRPNRERAERVHHVYLTRELGLPAHLRSLKVDVSSGVFVVDCQFIAPGFVDQDELDEGEGQ